ncbi:MAG: hypothetical protein LH631_00395 [Alkalinema sp. CAN_BIN05]|nr:hypothetical protein [Alkalinema sp. CAN_BIN05]
MTILILVPQGAEFKAVMDGLNKSQSKPILPVLAIPAGPAVKAFLEQESDRLWGVTQVIVLGLCGGLTNDAVVGQMGCYEMCCDRSGNEYQCDYLDIGYKFINWNAVTIDNVITKSADKQLLNTETNCDVVDMESIWILEFIQQRGIGVSVVRAVSDAVVGDLPDLSQVFDLNGRLKPIELARAFVLRPRAALRLIRGSIFGLKQLTRCTTMISEQLHRGK